MWGNKCSNCAKKIKKEFNFCPYCGLSFKQYKEQDEFGLFGRDDLADFPMKMPLGNLDKIMAPLVKQLAEQFDKEFSQMKNTSNLAVPKGFKIQITAGPRSGQIQQTNKNEKCEKTIIINDKEIERRRALPRKEAASNVRRLSDKVIYEISVPGVKDKQDIAITKLENGVEIKAYSNDACYVKSIPLNAEIAGYGIKDGTLTIELKN